MDLTLERIISLIPKKADGKYVHGAKKEFCERIGAPTNIVSEWEAGKTKSYRNYIHAIAMEYDVSVSWLKGETDEKNPAPQAVGRNQEDMEFMNLYQSAPEDIRAAVLTILRNGAGK